MTSTSSSGDACLSISDLTPRCKKWQIYGRVTSKSDVREYNNGTGCLFSFVIHDKKVRRRKNSNPFQLMNKLLYVSVCVYVSVSVYMYMCICREVQSV